MTVTFSTTLPTEPGIYLFCGKRDRADPDVRDLTDLRGVEIVRVFRNGSGKLCYTGSDFFYRPEQALGIWVPFTAEAEVIREHAVEAVTVHLLQNNLREAAKPTLWGFEFTREDLVHKLVGSFRTPAVVMAGHALIDRAIAEGILVPASPLASISRWQLAPNAD